MRLYEFQGDYIGPLVYHGSKDSLDILEPRESKLVKDDVVFAAILLDVAVAMAGHWTDDDFAFERIGRERKGEMVPYHFEELREGAFEEFFSDPTYVYLLPSEDFSTHRNLQDFEVVSTKSVEPSSFVKIENPLEFLENSAVVTIKRFS